MGASTDRLARSSAPLWRVGSALAMSRALRGAAAGFAGLAGFLIALAPLRALLLEALSGLVSAPLALLAGVTAGFLLGFFGPMVFTPGANQGPMLGIFITCPLGLLWGARRRFTLAAAGRFGPAGRQAPET